MNIKQRISVLSAFDDVLCDIQDKIAVLERLADEYGERKYSDTEKVYLEQAAALQIVKRKIEELASKV